MATVSMTAWRRRRINARKSESLDETLKRIRRAEIVVDLGAGSLLAPSRGQGSNGSNSAALGNLLAVARSGSIPVAKQS